MDLLERLTRANCEQDGVKDDEQERDWSGSQEKSYDRPASTQQRGDQRKSAAPTLSANHAPTGHAHSTVMLDGASESN